MSSNDTNDTNGTLHTPSSTGNLDLFDIDNVQIVNIHTATGFPLCDAYIGREWKESYGPTPLVGSDGVFGNPYTVEKYGREECLHLYEGYLKSPDSKEYRKRARSQLPGCYKWGCHCAPEACHSEILKKWLKRDLQVQKARQAYHSTHGRKGGDSKA